MLVLPRRRWLTACCSRTIVCALLTALLTAVAPLAGGAVSAVAGQSAPRPKESQGPSVDAPPDRVLLGGKVFTADSTRPWAEAVAVRGERIVAVGTTAEVARLAGPRTRRIALGGRTVVPGFNDAHDHLPIDPLRQVTVTVDPTPFGDPPLATVLDSVAAAALRSPRGARLVAMVGARVLDDPRTTRALLDSVVPTHPVWLVGLTGGHGGVANTAHLRAAGLLDAPDPTGGWLGRDARGGPTGPVDEYAIFNAYRRLAMAGGLARLRRVVREHGEAGLRLGITTVQDMAGGYDLASACAIARGGGMRARHRVMRFPTTDGPGGRLADWRVAGADTALTPTMHVSGVKWVLDGTNVERLALMRRPYADQPGWYGRANFPFDTLRALLRDALARGEQPILHAIGDSTIALVIAAMRAEAPDSAWRRLRPRIEHGTGLGRDQLAAVRALGIVVVQNPTHLTIPEILTARLGAERLRGLELLRTLVDSGVPLALGSDGPREPGVNVMFATLHPHVPSEALTREQAVAAYTRGSAYAEFAEGEKGTLAPGMLADLAVLSQDLFTVAPDALPATTSVLTLVGGRVLFDAGVLKAAPFHAAPSPPAPRGPARCAAPRPRR